MFRPADKVPLENPVPFVPSISKLASTPRTAGKRPSVTVNSAHAAGGDAHRRVRRAPRATALAGLLVGITGCTLGPGERFDALVADQGLESSTVQGTEFLHRVVRKPARHAGDRLHVYLAGDGSPWIRRRHVAADPTAREPLALRLMLRDPSDALYFGRPCYHRADPSPPCHPRLWTHARYGGAVVDSMAAALQRLLREERASRAVTLFGFSGGGTLAMLLAQRIDAVDRVVTVAANLDIDAWTRLHAYSPLHASMNPATRRPLRAEVQQLHLVGSDDSDVPPDLVAQALRHQPAAELAVVAGFDHRCCWETAWPEFVQAAQRSRPACEALARSVPLASCGRTAAYGR